MSQELSPVVSNVDMDQLSPVILKVGKKKKRAIKDFKRGRGRLMYEIEQTLADVRAALGARAAGKELVPVVMIYRQKQKRRRRLW